MPVLIKKKLRPDVRKLCEEIEKLQLKGAITYLSNLKNTEIDFMKLWQRVLKINEQVYRKEIDLEESTKLLTKEEMLFLSKVLHAMFEFMSEQDQKNSPIPDNVKVKGIDAGGVPAEWQLAPNASRDKVILYFHGGGFILGSPNSHRLFTVTLGSETKMRVLSVDYRLAPEHQFPASLEDCVTAYKWLLSEGFDPKKIIIMGDSAGGNLTLITLLKLKEENLPLPAGAICLSPVTDWNFADESFWKNAETDPILADAGSFWWYYAYAGDSDKNNPYLSPIYGNMEKLPPLLLQASKSEMLYSDSKRFVEKAKSAGVDATLQVWDDMPHVFQSFGLNILPESKEAIEEIKNFVKKVIS
jgi:monoterpene epsilon-lactone hydrolase